MPKTRSTVVAINLFRRIVVVRVDGENHAVVGLEDAGQLKVGDQLTGHFGKEGATTLQNIATGRQFASHNLVVDCSATNARVYAT